MEKIQIIESFIPLEQKNGQITSPCCSEPITLYWNVWEYRYVLICEKCKWQIIRIEKFGKEYDQKEKKNNNFKYKINIKD